MLHEAFIEPNVGNVEVLWMIFSGSGLKVKLETAVQTRKNKLFQDMNKINVLLVCRYYPKLSNIMTTVQFRTITSSLLLAPWTWVNLVIFLTLLNNLCFFLLNTVKYLKYACSGNLRLITSSPPPSTKISNKNTKMVCLLEFVGWFRILDMIKNYLQELVGWFKIVNIIENRGKTQMSWHIVN